MSDSLPPSRKSFLFHEDGGSRKIELPRTPPTKIEWQRGLIFKIDGTVERWSKDQAEGGIRDPDSKVGAD